MFTWPRNWCGRYEADDHVRILAYSALLRLYPEEAYLAHQRTSFPIFLVSSRRVTAEWDKPEKQQIVGRGILR